LKNRVSIVRCSVEASDSEVEESVRKAVELSGALDRLDLEGKKVLIKPNMGGIRLNRYRGWWLYLSDPRIAEAVVKMLREEGCGEILLADNPAIPGFNVPASQWSQPLFKDAKGLINTIEDFYRLMGYDRLKRRYGVKLLNVQEGPYVKIPVPSGGLASKWYRFNHVLGSVDVVVSISKMKNHGLAGVTLTIKNLFGLCPYPRAHYAHYEHTPIMRFPYFMVDLTRIFKPRLCIIDGVVASEGSEWFGKPREVGVIIAGGNPVSTDSVGMMVMGYDPMVDMPEPPFWWTANYVKLAAENGEGVADPGRIEIVGERVGDVRQEFTKSLSRVSGGVTPEIRARFAQRQMEQIRLYNENKEQFIAKYSGRTIFMLDGRVEIVLAGKKLREAFMMAKARFGMKAFEGVTRFVSRDDPTII